MQSDNPEHRPCMGLRGGDSRVRGTAFGDGIQQTWSCKFRLPASKATSWLHRHEDQAQRPERGSRGSDQPHQAGP